MAKRNPADVSWFLVGGRQIGGELTAFEDRVEAMVEQSETLGDTWTEQSYVGVRTAELSLDGFYNDAQGSIHDALNASADLAPPICYTLENSTYGAGFVGWAAGAKQNYERLFSIGELHKVRSVYQTQGPVDYGKQLWFYKSASATGVSTAAAIDNGVSTTGAAGYLQYNATNGEANIRIIHSSDGISWATLLTFTKTSSGVATGTFGAERVVTTAAVERYTAIDFSTATATGGNATAGSLVFMVGLARNLTTR